MPGIFLTEFDLSFVFVLQITPVLLILFLFCKEILLILDWISVRLDID